MEDGIGSRMRGSINMHAMHYCCTCDYPGPICCCTESTDDQAAITEDREMGNGTGAAVRTKRAEEEEEGQ